MCETFIKIDPLQHLEISRQTYPTNRSKKKNRSAVVAVEIRPPPARTKIGALACYVTVFCRCANFSKLMQTRHISITNTF